MKKPLSVPAISSWESTNSPKVPPVSRLGDVATFFATRRSVDGNACRLLADDELTEDERSQRDKLLQELLVLRSEALRKPGASVSGSARASVSDPEALGSWHFPDQGSVTIVCA